jgi:hypothetical protein
LPKIRFLGEISGNFREIARNFRGGEFPGGISTGNFRRGGSSRPECRKIKLIKSAEGTVAAVDGDVCPRGTAAVVVADLLFWKQEKIN